REQSCCPREWRDFARGSCATAMRTPICSAGISVTVVSPSGRGPCTHCGSGGTTAIGQAIVEEQPGGSSRTVPLRRVPDHGLGHLASTRWHGPALRVAALLLSPTSPAT